jgi:hypothetical protein
MSSPALAEPIDTASFNWVLMDDEPVSAVYSSIIGMKSAPLHLAGEKARQYAKAKETRRSRAATPLTIE